MTKFVFSEREFLVVPHYEISTVVMCMLIFDFTKFSSSESNFKKPHEKIFFFSLLGHVLIVLASNVEMLYGGRILCGLCQGFCNCLTIVYVLEFCHNVKEMAICGVVLALIGKSSKGNIKSKDHENLCRPSFQTLFTKQMFL